MQEQQQAGQGIDLARIMREGGMKVRDDREGK